MNICRGVVKPGDSPADAVPGSVFVGHVGFVAHGPDGTLHMIHSTTPQVREEPLAQYIARSTASAAELDAAGKPRLVGFKFLRLEDDPLGESCASSTGPTHHVSRCRSRTRASFGTNDCNNAIAATAAQAD